MTENKDLLKRFNRMLAWLTLIVFVVFVFAGYGMTNPAVTSALSGGVFNKANSFYIHVHLAALVVILLMVHVLIGLRNALTRRGVKEGLLLDVFLVVLGVFVGGLVLVLQYFVL